MLVLVFVVQCVLVLAFVGPIGATYIAETLFGLVVLVNFLLGVPKRIVTGTQTFSIRGFFIGVPEATVNTDDLISVVYRRVHFPGGRAPIQWFVIGLRAQSSDGDFQLPIYGWTHNRQLFFCIADMVSRSGIPVDSRTARTLTRVSGITVKAR
jgi:hypothetical protein